MTVPERTEALRLLMADHLPAYRRLPSDFLVWTAAGERTSPEQHLYSKREGRDQRPTETRTPLERLTR
ncbi:hypothetical protein DVJ83_08730 [Deinococcus wulumuqiensis]|uniref:Uncharacterized protein n=1 Tax=Deinococcus wulumuqiensis TaxID=980427 RepID=A0A345IHP9_9DEIO|nr:hypothetical protein [Deinococcus wulumuqiensis]AXG99221.1 hypothetical protein DVJ83_08730 [Deinococcus wulumuqiensis]